MVSSNEACFTCSVHLNIKIDEAMYLFITGRWGYTIIKKLESNLDIHHLFVPNILPEFVTVGFVKFYCFLVCARNSNSELTITLVESFLYFETKRLFFRKICGTNQ